ncbi:MAG: TIM barrel protein, partial [Chloroflexi bacterium]|nr:TIM barrel protein [Chloroflexota bacterium]
MPLTIGGHVSLNGKPRATVRQLAEDGFGCLQIFASSPGSWKPPAVDTVIAQDFSLAREEFGVRPLVIHAIYLINLASADSTLATRSRSSLKATLGAGAKLGAAAVVTHIGSHAGRGFGAVAEQIAQGLVEILESAPEGVDLLLENSAGAGAIVGSELGELGDLIRR